MVIMRPCTNNIIWDATSFILMGPRVIGMWDVLLCMKMSHQTKLIQQYSIFTAETVALLQAIHHVNLHYMPKSVICVYSLSILLALQATESFRPLIRDK